MVNEKERQLGSEEEKMAQTTGTPALPQRTVVSSNTVDITGRVCEDVRIDPNITEGHPGYEESGESQIIPLDRLTRSQEEKG